MTDCCCCVNCLTSHTCFQFLNVPNRFKLQRSLVCLALLLDSVMFASNQAVDKESTTRPKCMAHLLQNKKKNAPTLTEWKKGAFNKVLATRTVDWVLVQTLPSSLFCRVCSMDGELEGTLP